MSALSEFSLIEQFFSHLSSDRNDVELGIGDDCALLKIAPDKLLAVSMDTLIEGVHFFPDVDPQTLSHKSLAAGLSDLAAMGATPAWFTLALTLPRADAAWLKDFCRGLADLAEQTGIQLIGGDTTRGPLAITIQVHGFVDKQYALRRDAAQAGDLIYVTGTLGDAGAALKTRLDNWQPAGWQQTDYAFTVSRLEKPAPRLEISQQLHGLSVAAIDISDGLLADLGHILDKSGVGAEIELSALPLSVALQKLDKQTAYQLALSSGDDYELCFTVKADKAARLASLDLDIHCIGKVLDRPGLIVKEQGRISSTVYGEGYDHFGR